ncbi:RNA polymerase sigma factor [Paenibacillus sp. 7541]|uniref:RNA polymerase sigma factor n=1 Tax=Paenibacillus sp. 7541 TaxID=2026236 RepID=UPI000BA61B68|nr:RNA polymerase sigma factor [Paenibacillus sp. 7541]PAK54489.1 hypothetical protein CHH75_06440 [Paenibacillus sp. 7541]
MTIIQPESHILMLSQQRVEELHALLHRYCLSLTGCPWDTEDLVQDTWLKVLDKFQKRTHSNPEALLLRTAKNTWIDRVRRNRVYRRIVNEWLVQGDEMQTEQLDRKLQTEAVFQLLLQHLSRAQCTVFVLREGWQFSVAEAASLLDTTQGAVKAALHRARKALEAAELEEDAAWTAMTEAEVEEVDGQLLQALATAYLAGDVDEVVRLIQTSGQPRESVMAVGMLLPQHRIQSGYGGTLEGSFAVSCMGIVMAA